VAESVAPVGPRIGIVESRLTSRRQFTKDTTLGECIICCQNDGCTQPSCVPFHPTATTPAGSLKNKVHRRLPSLAPYVAPVIVPSLCLPYVPPSVAPIGITSVAPSQLVPSPLSAHTEALGNRSSFVPSSGPVIVPSVVPSRPTKAPVPLPIVVSTCFTEVQVRFPSFLSTKAMGHTPSDVPTLAPVPSGMPNEAPVLLPSALPPVPTEAPVPPPSAVSTMTLGPSAMPTKAPVLLPIALPTKAPIARAMPTVSPVPSALPTGTPMRHPGPVSAPLHIGVSAISNTGLDHSAIPRDAIDQVPASE
jgi:hypothetical protein